ncbi:hypothetical protein GS539_24785 [Rhodococcus hoagii]|nr:hypothetical protein [Prescottella equi]
MQNAAEQFDGFDFMRDVIGDDLVVEGVAYNAAVWKEDGEGGVERRDTIVETGAAHEIGEIAALLNPDPWDPWR